MKGFNFTLRLMQLGGRREGFSNRLPTHLVCQAVVGAMTGLIGQMAMAVGLATAALNGGNGAAAKVAQLQDLVQDGGAMLFQILPAGTAQITINSNSTNCVGHFELGHF